MGRTQENVFSIFRWRPGTGFFCCFFPEIVLSFCSEFWEKIVEGSRTLSLETNKKTGTGILTEILVRLSLDRVGKSREDLSGPYSRSGLSMFRVETFHQQARPFNHALFLSGKNVKRSTSALTRLSGLG